MHSGGGGTYRIVFELLIADEPLGHFFVKPTPYSLNHRSPTIGVRVYNNTLLSTALYAYFRADGREVPGWLKADSQS